MTYSLDSAHLDAFPDATEFMRRRARLHCIEQGVDHQERRMFLEALGLEDRGFYEEDEPVVEVIAAFDAGEKGLTGTDDGAVQPEASSSVSGVAPSSPTCAYGHEERKPWCAPCRNNWPLPPS